MTNIENAWRPFEPSREAVDDARRVTDDRCAICGWPLAASVAGGCVRGNCSMRPPPRNPYAPERAKEEAAELLQRALRNGMPPSGRWA